MKPTFSVLWTNDTAQAHINSTTTTDNYRQAKILSEEKLGGGATWCAIGLEWAGVTCALTDATKQAAFISCLAGLNIPPSVALEAIRQVSLNMCMATAGRYHIPA